MEDSKYVVKEGNVASEAEIELGNLQVSINLVNTQLKSLRADMRRICSDKKLDLDSRWKVYCEAPKDVHESNVFVTRLQVFEGKDALIKNITWYDDFYVERYSQVDLVDIYNRIEEGSALEDQMAKLDPLDQELFLMMLKEEILRGPRYFTYDW